MRLGFGLGVTALAYLRASIPPVVTPVYSDPDLNMALAFKQKVKSYDQGSGDRAAQLFAAFPALRAYLNVGHKSGSLTSASTDARWNASTSILSLTTALPNVSGLDVPGSVLIGSGVAANVTISDTRIAAKADGSGTNYKVQKDNSNDSYRVTLTDVTLENGQANDPGTFSMERVYHRYSSGDNFKGGTSGGASNPQYIRRSWFEAAGYGNPTAHGDGGQYSTTGYSRVVSSAFFSAPVFDDRDTITNSSGQVSSNVYKYTGPYGTGSYGLTNAIRIDSSGAPKNVQCVHILGNLIAFGSYYPLSIGAQQTDSVTRNITIAHNIFGPKAFRYDKAPNDLSQIHPTFTDNLSAGGGLVENVLFFGNEVLGLGPLQYKDRDQQSADITGIWHYNAATLDAATVALWKDLGALQADGSPASGMLRSVAGVIGVQPKTIATTGAVALNLDLSTVPSDAVVTLHIPNTAGLYELEYVA